MTAQPLRTLILIGALAAALAGCRRPAEKSEAANLAAPQMGQTASAAETAHEAAAAAARAAADAAESPDTDEPAATAPTNSMAPGEAASSEAPAPAKLQKPEKH